MPAPVETSSPSPLWQKAVAQIEAQRAREKAFAERLRRDLLTYPGYFGAAVARVAELQELHRDRPHWRCAMERWAALLDQGGLPAVLQMLEAPEEHQEMISTSPFTLIRPPLPENRFHTSHAAA